MSINPTKENSSESDVKERVKKFCKGLGLTLFRNNVGLTKTKHGTWLRYGLCNGSSDQIGWTPLTVTNEHIGKTLAIFTAIELKRPKIKQSKKLNQQGQAEGKTSDEQTFFIELVKASGGIAGVATCEDDILNILKEHDVSTNVML